MRKLGFWESERSLTVLAVMTVISVFVIAPLTHARGRGSLILAVGYLGLLLTGIGAVSRSRLEVLGVSAMAAVSSIAWLAAIWLPGPEFLAGRAAGAALFCVLLSGVVFRHVFRAGRVTVHRISGAVAAYVLIGLFFSFVYDAIELIWPGSFNFATSGARGEGLSDPLAYYSYTTLTTVGYGDVTPLTPLTQSLSNVEALIGQLFPAILIARLVALEVSPQPDSSD